MKALRATEVGATAVEAIRHEWRENINDAHEPFMRALAYGFTDAIIDVATGNALRADGGNDSLLAGGDANETLTGYGGNDILYAGAGNDSLDGGSGNDILFGEAGNDTLIGGYGDDILHGGGGDDRMEGGVGDDIYLFNLGDGHDVIHDFDSRTGKRNVVRFGAGIDGDSLEFSLRPATGNPVWIDLIITVKSTGETLTVEKALCRDKANSANNYSIQAIEFADGTVWEWEDIIGRPLYTPTAAGTYCADVAGSHLIANTDQSVTLIGSSNADTLIGGSGDDILQGGYGDDILHGDAGDDRMEGGVGDDIYLFNLGDGHDVIYEFDSRTGKRNVVRFGAGIDGDSLEFSLRPATGNPVWIDLIITVKSTGETLTVEKALCQNKANSANNYSIQAIEFADGTVWEWEDIVGRPFYTPTAAGTYCADVAGSHLIANTGQSVTLIGSSNADTLIGGSGGDLLQGGYGDDVLHGGGGTDRLEGGAGNDTYLYNLGDGQDTIYDTAGSDKLVFGSDVDVTDLWFTKSGNNLIINVADSDNSVTVQNWYSNNAYKVESIQSGGMELVHSQMDQLIQALASFGAPAGVDGGWTEEQKEALEPILATYWRPTGS